jgi:predicted nucleic acid-binding protein
VSDCVIDASVGIKLLLEEDLSDKADALFAQLVADPPARFYVPDLFYIECGNILWKHCQRFGYPRAQAREAIADLQALALTSVPTRELLPSSFALAIEHGITAYDASYVALAEGLRLPLVTADEKLVRMLEGTAYQVRGLRDLALPPVTGA